MGENITEEINTLVLHIAIRDLNSEYGISSFMRDLPKIREEIFKEHTDIYIRALPAIQTPIVIPSTFREPELQLQQWKTRILDFLSSPSCKNYSNWVGAQKRC